MTIVRYPEMRLNLRNAAGDLADETFHADVWAHPDMPTPDKRFRFGEAIAYIVDDLDVPSPRTLVGEVLVDEQEFVGFENLSNALNAMLARIGSTGTYAQAIATSEWDTVRAAARNLTEVLSRSDRQ